MSWPISSFVVRDADASAKLAQHIDADASVRCVYHHVHCALGCERVAESGESGIWVFKMMKDSGADNLVEGFFQFVQTIDRELVNFKIRQVVFSLEFLGAANTGGAQVDACHLGFGPAQRVLGGLGCSAARNENGMVFSIGSGWARRDDNPRGVFVGSASAGRSRRDLSTGTG